jgi:DNA-binding MarR family transcriptional regulator
MEFITRAPDAARLDLSDLFSDLVRYETELWNSVDARLRAVHDLPLARFESMQIIDRTPRCRVIDIAGSLSITVGGTSKLVDRIEASGLCRRLPDPTDGRSSFIELTADGKEMLAHATQTYRAALDAAFGPTVSDTSLTSFADTLRQLRQSLREPSGTAGD